MNVLLVYPKYPETFWSFKYALKFISKKASFPPLGLMTVASLLPEDWNVRLLDLNVRDMADSDLDWADMVMISAMRVQKKSVDQVVEKCRQRGIKVVGGG
ncbi:MAG TPA: B12-binding domain-containing radical SAM protein, partial [candidate division WOR-3 bacterium]|nr:B12-binding domain-containing radical SAM protein [candidate division WOR-3 bacterium]